MTRHGIDILSPHIDLYDGLDDYINTRLQRQESKRAQIKSA